MLRAAVLARVAAERAGRREGLRPGGLEGSGSGREGWVRSCLRIALAAARALDHAPAQGFLHRDVKPSNLMQCADGRTLVLDFGLTLEEGDARLTRSGDLVGSPAYMAPEQIRGEALDARTDVYALGVTLYEMLALRLPFLAKNQDELRKAVLFGAANSAIEG